MKKCTLEQLKTEKIAINVRTKEEAKSLLGKFDEIGLSGGNRDVDDMFGKNENRLCFNIDRVEPSRIGWCHTSYYKEEGYTIIIPDQIDWGEDKQTEAGQDNSPAVIAKAVKDWNAFKSFVKEIETHGRGLTSSQLKRFMAKVRKDMGEVKR